MYPKVNQNIIIKAYNQDKSLKSIVADVGDKEIFVGFPMDQDNFGLLQIGTKVEVIYSSDINKFKFVSEIVGRKIENISLLILKKPEENEIFKIQLREDFRVNVNLPILLKEKESNTINISAGGLLCSYTTDMQLSEGEILSGSIMLPGFTNEEASTISFQCEITRVDLVKEAERYHVALKFIELAKHDQRKIIQFCIEKQRQLRSKNQGFNSISNQKPWKFWK